MLLYNILLFLFKRTFLLDVYTSKSFYFSFIFPRIALLSLFVFIFLSEKQRIDSGYYLYQAEVKSKKEKEALKAKKIYSNLGAMFAADKNIGSTENSSNSDEDFVLHHAKK